MVDIESITGRGYSFNSSEYVSGGHPDASSDTVSAKVLEKHIQSDPLCHVAAETLMTSSNHIIMAGEISSRLQMTDPEYIDLARGVIREIGWRPDFGYDPDSVIVMPLYHTQSPDIAQGVEVDGHQIGAGDQGITVGYAIRNKGINRYDDDHLPLPVALSRGVLLAIDDLRRTDPVANAHLKPDMKSELILENDTHGVPQGIKNLVLALSHTEDIDVEGIRRLIADRVAAEFSKFGLWYDLDKAIINGTGKFVVAGAMGDTGLTGRKLAINQYGPGVPIGGGAIHGKDPSKADATGAMLGRWVANQVVGNELADECFVRMIWAIGHPEPLQVVIDTAGTEKVPMETIKRMLQNIDWSLGAAIDRFGGRRPAESHILYDRLAAWGPFGRVPDGSARPWETVVEPDKWNQWRV